MWGLEGTEVELARDARECNSREALARILARGEISTCSSGQCVNLEKVFHEQMSDFFSKFH